MASITAVDQIASLSEETMIRIVVATLLALILTSCAREGVGTEAHGNFQAEELFTHKGCTIYRFYDAGRYIYYSDCSASMVSWQSSCGKGCTRNNTVPSSPAIREEETGPANWPN